jgi:3-methylfumaryl-CoA hydratase
MQTDHSFRAAVGTTASARDVVTEVPVAALWATLDRLGVPPKNGEAIPLGWHVLYFLPTFRPHELRFDGSPSTTGVLPELPFQRRMFGGLRLDFTRPLRVGDVINRKTELVGLDLKQGKSGRLCVATVKSEISGPLGLAVTETITTVFRDEAKLKSVQPLWTINDDASSEASKTIQPNTVLLARYSALTFNSHRIHFDRPYAVEIPGKRNQRSVL